MSPAKKMAVAGFLNFLLLAILNFLVSPILLSLLGNAAFGAWKAGLRLLDFAAIADGRSAQLLKWLLAHEKSKEAASHKKETVGAAVVVWAVWLPLLLVILLLIQLNTPLLLKTEEADHESAFQLLMLLLGANVLLSGLLTMPAAILIGEGRGHIVMHVSSILVLVSNGFMLWFSYLGYGVNALAVTTLLVTCVHGLICLWDARRHLTWIGILIPSRSTVYRSLTLSFWTALGALTTTALLSTEMLLTSALVGVSLAAQLSFSTFANQFLLALCMLMASSIAPSVGHLVGKGDCGAAGAKVEQARSMVLFSSTLGASAIVLFNAFFVKLWVGEPMFVGNGLNVVLALMAIQAAGIRFDIQMGEACLIVRRINSIGILCSIGSIALALATFWYTDSYIYSLVAVISGRLPMTLGFPYLVEGFLGTRSLSRNTFATSIACALFSAAALVAHLLSEASGPMHLGGSVLIIALIFVAGWFLLLSSSARKALLRGFK